MLFAVGSATRLLIPVMDGRPAPITDDDYKGLGRWSRRSAVKVVTSRFGELDVEEKDVFEMASPLPGFPNSKNFFFLQKDNIKPFKWMQSIQEPGVTFVIVEPQYFFHDYVPQISVFDAKEIGAERADQLLLVVIVVLPEDLSKMTANLKGPLIMNREAQKMKQVLLETDQWSVRESIVDAIKRKEEAALKEQQEKK